MVEPQVQWVISVAEGDPIPSNAKVARILQTEERPVYGSTASKRYFVLLVEAKSSEIRHTTTLDLDDYEASNLQEGLLTLRKLGLDTGDWLGQLLYKLAKYDISREPNVDVETQLDRVEKRYSE